jgi:hypothetical protein
VRGFVAVAVFLVAGAAWAQSQPMLTKEPGPGQVKTGEQVLVDDHTCPAGQVKQVTGGHDIGHGTSGNKSKRIYACVPHP